MTTSVCLACFLGMTAQPAPETTGDTWQDERHIIVTGERIERPLLDTPSSVAVFREEEIEALAGVDRLEDLLSYVPGIQVGSGGEGPTIRGQDSTGVLRDLPAFLGGTRPRTTLQVDGRAVGFAEFVFGAAPLWDVERVEVFRSPQTTTQGRNSIAGAIFVETNDPTYDWEARARLIAGNGGVAQGSAAVSGPILNDQIAFRVTADARDWRSSSRIADLIPDADPNEANYALFRIKLLAEPRALAGARLELTYSHLESQAPQVEGVRRPFADRRDPLPGYGAYRTNVDAGSAVLRWRLPGDLETTTTITYGESHFQRLVRPGTGRSDARAADASAETILRWEGPAGLAMTGGVSLVDNHQDQRIDLSAIAVAGIGTFADDQTSRGVFGEATIPFAPHLSATLGVRYQYDRQVRVGAVVNVFRRTDLDYDGTFEAWLPKATLSYAPADGLLFGATVQRATNPGGATLRLDTGETDTFAAETLWAYELFARASLLDDRLTLRANLFYNDIRNAQRPQSRLFFPPNGPPIGVTEIDNAPAAETYGLELDLAWRATRRLTMQLGVAFLGTRTLETLDPADPFLGEPFQRAPTLTAVASVDWRPIEALRLSATARHQDGYYSDDAASPERRIGASTVIDARAAWTTGRLTLFAYARNLPDSFYLTYLFNPPLNGTVPDQGTAGDPRRVGIGIEARF